MRKGEKGGKGGNLHRNLKKQGTSKTSLILELQQQNTRLGKTNWDVELQRVLQAVAPPKKVARDGA